MRISYRWLGWLLAALLAGQASAQVGVEGDPGHEAGSTVRFALYWNYMIVVSGSAGPLHGLRFLVDTGASPTVLDPSVAHKLHLQEEAASIRVAGGVASAARAVVPSLRIGPATREDLPVFVEDLSFLQKALPFPIDGIVGLDVLGQSAFLIDYRSRVIQFGDARALPDAFPLLMRDGLPFVAAEVNGVPAQMLLDTGAASLTMFAGSARTAAVGMKVSAAGPSRGAIGEFTHTQVKLRDLQLGSSDLGRLTAAVIAGASPGAGIDGLLSPAALGIRRLVIDLPHHRASVEFK